MFKVYCKVDDEKEVNERLKKEIERCCKKAFEKSDTFRVGLSGGSLINHLIQVIPLLGDECKLSKWKFFFCDERYVDVSDPESTFGSYTRTLLPKTNFKIEQFVNIDMTLPLEKCASDYEHKIRVEFNTLEEDKIPEFDLLLLGMGPDGHTCSLFPDHKLLEERKALIAPISDSPKPPPKRVTMTFPLINNAKSCIFVFCGSAKSEIVKRVFKDLEMLPAGRVGPRNGEVVCIFDSEAGKHIN